MIDGLAIQQIDRMASALAEITNLHGALDFIDKAKAAKILFDAAGLAKHSNEVKIAQLRAERKAGQILLGMPKAQGGRPEKSTSCIVQPVDGPETYEELGIEKTQAHRWQSIASIPEETFEEIIAASREAEREITQSAFLRVAHKLKNESVLLEAPPIPAGKYSIIYADPPWRYDNSGFTQSAESHYPTMTNQEIYNLPVAKLAHDDCVLYLWATSPLLDIAFDAIKNWRFEYKASRVWIKNRAPGIGWWLNTYHEHLLICTRGNPRIPAEKLDSVIYNDVAQHSKKPEQVYLDIEAAHPSTKKVELFARNKRDGWQSWGAELAV